MGYSLAGFEVVGVDIEPQPHYPFEFIQADVFELDMDFLRQFDAIHASPPCQAHSMASRQWQKQGREYPELITPTRDMLIKSGKHYIIENVPGSPLINPIILNGGMFGLKVRRVRLFECSFDVPFFLLPDDAPTNFRMGRPIREGEAITPVGHFSNIPYAREQMEISWMTGAELTQAIPPAYTEWIGEHIQL